MNKIWMFVITLMIVGVVPAMAGTWAFTFATGTGEYSGHGILDVNSGKIDALTGSFELTGPPPATMTLVAPGGFASNDNVFSGNAPYVTENGLSFTANNLNYNIYYAATTTSYAFTVCTVGETCITHDPYGNPSTPVVFSAQQVPEPTALLLLGMMGTLVLGLKRKLS